MIGGYPCHVLAKDGSAGVEPVEGQFAKLFSPVFVLPGLLRVIGKQGGLAVNDLPFPNLGIGASIVEAVLVRFLDLGKRRCKG